MYSDDAGEPGPEGPLMTTVLVFLVGLLITGLIGFRSWVTGLRLANPSTFTFGPIFRGGILPVLWIVAFIFIVRLGLIALIAEKVNDFTH
jgi:hypothetical protein